MLRAVFGIQFGHPVVAGITGRGRCATLFGKLLTLLILGFAFFGLVCEARPRLTHDYIFSVNGVVAAEDGAPRKDAEIILEVNGPVYQAVTLVRTVKRSTDSRQIRLHVHQPQTRREVRREGFEPQTVSGSAPPAAHHTIRMKRPGGNDTIAGRQLRADDRQLTV
jgi:hypothetical protein